jgi:hypothetical protein
MTMSPERYLTGEIIPALTWLTAQHGRDMGPPEVLVQLLATALHEGDGLKARVQYGPKGSSILKRFGHSMWMFEGGEKAALAGLFASPATGPALRKACEWLGVEHDHQHVWWCMVGNDKLAAICGRLLLLTDPHPVPMLDDVDESYATYLRCWRPGKPPGPDKWRRVHQRALDAVARVHPTPERYEVASNLTAEDLAAIKAMLQPQAMSAAAGGMAMTDKQINTFRDQSLIVSPPSKGNQVIVNGPQSQNKHVQTAVAIAGLMPFVAQMIAQYADPVAAAAHNNDWVSVAGLVLTGLAVASQAWTERGSFKATAQVASAATDPVGQQAAVSATQVAPAPISASGGTSQLDLGALTDDQLDALAARIRAQPT